MPTKTEEAPASLHVDPIPDTTGAEVRRLVDATRQQLLDEALQKVEAIEDVLWQAKLHYALTIRDIGIANVARMWGMTINAVARRVDRIEKSAERREAKKRGGA